MRIIQNILDNTDYIRVYRLDNYKRALEEMPTNAMGSGAVAGGGVNGPDDVKMAKKAIDSNQPIVKDTDRKKGKHRKVREYVDIC